MVADLTVLPGLASESIADSVASTTASLRAEGEEDSRLCLLRRLALHPTVELSAVIVKPSPLAPSALCLLRPGGDTVLGGRLVRAQGFLSPAEIAVDSTVDRAIGADDAPLCAALAAAPMLWEHEELPDAIRLADEELRTALAEIARLHLEVGLRSATLERLQADAGSANSSVGR